MIKVAKTKWVLSSRVTVQSGSDMDSVHNRPPVAHLALIEATLQHYEELMAAPLLRHVRSPMRALTRFAGPAAQIHELVKYQFHLLPWSMVQSLRSVLLSVKFGSRIPVTNSASRLAVKSGARRHVCDRGATQAHRTLRTNPWMERRNPCNPSSLQRSNAAGDRPTAALTVVGRAFPLILSGKIQGSLVAGEVRAMPVS